MSHPAPRRRSPVRPGAVLACVACVVLTLVGGPARAQIVNVLQPQVGQEPDGFQFEVTQFFQGKGGNENKVTFESEVGLTFVGFPHTVLLTGSVEYAEVDKRVDTQKGFAHLRYVWSGLDPFGLFGFLQADHDRFRRLELRLLAGGGPACRFFRTKHAEWNGGLAAMFESEQLRRDVFDEQGQTARLSAYWTQAYTVAKRLTASNVTFAQPEVKEFTDFRLLNVTKVRVEITNHLFLVLSGRILYDSKPPLLVKEVDWRVSQGLELHVSVLPRFLRKD